MNPQDQWMIPLIAGAVFAVIAGIVVWELIHYLRTRPPPPEPTNDVAVYLRRIDRKLTAVNILAIIMLLSTVFSCLFVIFSLIVGGGLVASILRMLGGAP